MENIKVAVVRSDVKGITGGKVTITKTGDQGRVWLQSGLSRKLLTYISAFEWEEDYGRNIGKAAVGTIVGGVLTGGIGLIAGAAIGGRKRDTSTAVLLTNKNEELKIKLNAKEYQKVRGWL